LSVSCLQDKCRHRRHHRTSSKGKSSREKIPSVRCDLSKTGM
jgi:hypothetical protein